MTSSLISDIFLKLGRGKRSRASRIVAALPLLLGVFILISTTKKADEITTEIRAGAGDLFCERSTGFQYRHRHGHHTKGAVFPDKYLNENIFRNKTDGFYIEIGVLCPLKCSTGSFFDLELCWDGLCIDGNKDSHEATVSSPRSCNSQHGILCAANSATDTFIQVRGGGEGYSGIQGSLTSDHLALINAKESTGEWWTERIEMNCLDLKQLIREKQRSYVDLILLDVEGAELDVMRSFDFSGIPVEIFSIETDQESELTSVMSSHGYHKVGQVGYDVVYKRNI